MNTHFSYKGHFYLPDNPKKRISGIITFNQESGTELEIFGNFNPDNQKYEIILGQVEIKGFITLYSCINISKRFSTIFINKYRSIFLFTGANFYSKNELKFKHARIIALHFDEWINKSESFSIKESSDFKNIIVKYKTPMTINYDINSDFKIFFNFFPSDLEHSVVQKEIKIRQISYINFKYKRRKFFNDIVDDIYHFVDLLTLLTYTNSQTNEITFNLPLKEFPHSIDVGLFIQSTKRKANHNKLQPDDFIFPNYIIENKFDGILKKWYHDKVKRSTSSLPLFNEIYQLNLTTVDKFLSLSKSLEAYHRDYLESKDVYFVDRVSCLFERSRKIINPLLKIRSKPKFSQKIKKYRNDYTHSNPRISDTRVFIELHYLKQAMKLIMLSQYYIDLGIEEGLINERFVSSHKFDHLKSKIKC
ncbi:MAG: hypothetical protein KDC90_11070 [Ignavibacteriae bacterium]|nr:hypothetical protein [Ignavibacteriota bacterium]